MKQFTKQVAALAIMSSFFLEALFLPLPVASAAPAPQQALWQQPYHFRREVTVSNPASVGLENYPVVLTLTFAPNHLFDATDELRVFSASGTEVPSLVLGEQVANGSVTSASVLFPVTIPAGSNASFWVYYGYLQAGLPSYRVGASASTASSGALSASLGSPGASSFITFAYAGTYSQTLQPFVSYSHADGSFSGGPTPLSGWETYGGGAMAEATFTAGTLRVSQAVVASNSSIVSVFQVRNEGGAAVSGATVSLVLNDTQLARLGPLAASYSATLGLATVSVAAAHLNFLASPLPTSHLVATSAGIDGALGLTPPESFGPPSVLLSWKVGSLPPGGAYTLVGTMTVSSSSGAAGLPSAPPSVDVGQEQYSSGDFVPSMVGIWNAQVNLSNVAVSSSGAAVPVSVENGTWLPRTVSAQGTMTYTLPVQGSSEGLGGGWTRASSAKGNATAYASPAFWSVADESYVGRVAAFNYDSTGSATASLSSAMTSLGASSSSYLVVDYRAGASATQGDYAQQQFYLALNVYNGTTVSPVRSLYFPVSGSSTALNETVTCGSPSQATVGAPSGVKPTIGGYLIGDSTWRTLDVNVGGLLSSSGMKFQILFCASSSVGFAGSMDLQVRNAGVRVTAPVGGLLGVSLSSSQNMTVTFPGGLFGPSGGANVNLSVEMEVVTSAKMNQTSGTLFTSYLPEPTVSSVGWTAGVELSPNGVVVYTPLAGREPGLTVNGSSVQGVQSSDGIVYAPGRSLSSLGLIDPPAVSQMQLSFAGSSVGVEVTDAGGNPLAGAVVKVQPAGSIFDTSATTSSDGGTSFDLLPWNYSVTVAYRGVPVYHSVVSLNSSRTVQVKGNVYGVTVRANDLLGHPLGNAEIEVSGYGVSKILTTSGGAVKVLLPAGTRYNATVDVNGIQYFDGSITATAQGSTIPLDTAYISTTLQLAIGFAVVAILLGVALYLNRPFFSRTLRQVKKPTK